MRRFLGIACVVLILFSLCSCSFFKDKDEEDVQDGGQAMGLQIGAPSDAVSFDLKPPTDPGFTEGIDLSGIPVGDGIGVSDSENAEPLYVERDGYAYRVDSTTLEPVGGPLDLETHEPISSADLESLDREDSPAIDKFVLEGSDESSKEEQTTPTSDKSPAGTSATAVEPTEETKYPNTGIFLEDD